MPPNIIEFVGKYYDSPRESPNSRSRSWEHCYNFFSEPKLTPEYAEMAALHLAFYLASWGMYRGSAMLFQKDYTVHRGAVRILFLPEYASLRNITLDGFKDQRATILLFKLIREIDSHYKTQLSTLSNMSDTLITKVLMGTLGCVLAYDRYVKAGIRCCELPFSYLNPTNFNSLLSFCQSHAGDFDAAQKSIFERGGVLYPPMKIIDMYFYSVGRYSQENRN